MNFSLVCKRSQTNPSRLCRHQQMLNNMRRVWRFRLLELLYSHDYRKQLGGLFKFAGI
jgi:hypothetical protein